MHLPPHNSKPISTQKKAAKGRVRTKISPACDRPPRGRVAVTVAAAATMRKVMASHASPFAISEASGMGIPKAAAPLPVGWRGTAGGILIDYMLRKNKK